MYYYVDEYVSYFIIKNNYYISKFILIYYVEFMKIKKLFQLYFSPNKCSSTSLAKFSKKLISVSLFKNLHESVYGLVRTHVTEYPF